MPIRQSATPAVEATVTEARDVIDRNGLDRRLVVPVDALDWLIPKMDAAGAPFAALPIADAPASIVAGVPTVRVAVYSRQPGVPFRAGAKATASDVLAASGFSGADIGPALVGRWSERAPMEPSDRYSWE